MTRILERRLRRLEQARNAHDDELVEVRLEPKFRRGVLSSRKP